MIRKIISGIITIVGLWALMFIPAWFFASWFGEPTIYTLPLSFLHAAAVCGWFIWRFRDI